MTRKRNKPKVATTATRGDSPGMSYRGVEQSVASRYGLEEQSVAGTTSGYSWEEDDGPYIFDESKRWAVLDTFLFTNSIMIWFTQS